LLHLLGERGLHELVEVIIVVVRAAKHRAERAAL
jgi:hypothetical protein